jgi:hypothetical protein
METWEIACTAYLYVVLRIMFPWSYEVRFGRFGVITFWRNWITGETTTLPPRRAMV